MEPSTVRNESAKTNVSADTRRMDLVEADFRSLSQRLGAIEKLQLEAREKTPIERLGMWGGAMALLISIATGTFTLYDAFVRTPRGDREKRVAQVETIISTISSVTQDAGVKVAGITDPIQKQNVLGLLNSQILSLVRSAEGIEGAVRSRLNASDYLILGNAEAQISNYEGAKKYLQIAVDKSADDPATQAEILRFQGRTLGYSGVAADLDAARSAFQRAFAIEEKWKTYTAPGQRVILNSDRAVTEYYFGQCEKGDAYLKAIETEMDTNYINPDTLRALRANLISALSAQTRCPFNRRPFLP